MSHTVCNELPEVGIQPVPTGDSYRRWGKRCLDIFIVVLILPIALPLILVSWALAKTDGGSGFYSQTRIGRDSRGFKCWKIRTMVPDADVVLSQLVGSDKAAANEWRMAQKLSDDPRITPLGRMLRKSSIDELPQLWNVLIGDMSLIGPRPFTPLQKHIYDRSSADPAYYKLRPGITGLWQVECRNEGDFSDRFNFDEQYCSTVTLGTDISIALKTLKVVVQATGQ